MALPLWIKLCFNDCVLVKDALTRTKGVGDVISRADDFSMRIWLKPDKLAALGITATDVTAALTEQNAQVAAGTVGGTPQEKAQPFEFEYTVLVQGRLTEPEEFEDVIVRTQPNTGAVVHLKDVARVELGKFNYANNSYVDGKRASYLLIYQAPGSNALETADNVYATMDQLKKSFPSDVSYVVPFESITVVKVSVHEVVITLLIALLLVTVVVFLFLQSWRTTLIPVLAIPVSIIGTFIFFIPLHFTINTLTLFGFVLAIGIVVDDAIVVVESVQHYIWMKKVWMQKRGYHTCAMQDISYVGYCYCLNIGRSVCAGWFYTPVLWGVYSQLNSAINYCYISINIGFCCLVINTGTLYTDVKTT